MEPTSKALEGLEIITATDARKDILTLMRKVKDGKRPVALTVMSEPVVVLVTTEDYEELIRLRAFEREIGRKEGWQPAKT